jgi:hypothetical protein
MVDGDSNRNLRYFTGKTKKKAARFSGDRAHEPGPSRLAIPVAAPLFLEVAHSLFPLLLRLQSSL